MDIKSFSELYTKIKSKSLYFAYQGVFSDKITLNLVDVNENNISDTSEVKKLRKKINFLMVECLQNVYRHGEDEKVVEKTSEKGGFFYLTNENNYLTIATSNLVNSKAAKTLSDNLDQVNTSDEAGVKKLYLEILNNESYTEKGGAGLGLVDMARKSGHPLLHQIESYNEELSRFYFQLNLKPKTKDKKEFKLDNAIGYHNLFLDNHIKLIYGGDFNNEIIMPILTTIEENINKKNTNNKQRRILYHLIVELFQNIVHYGKEGNEALKGLFAITENAENMELYTGNIIHKSQKADLERYLDYLSHLSSKEIAKLYIEKLTNDNDSGLGLVDVAKFSTDPITYSFTKLDDEFEFYAIKCVV